MIANADVLMHCTRINSYSSVLELLEDRQLQTFFRASVDSPVLVWDAHANCRERCH